MTFGHDKPLSIFNVDVDYITVGESNVHNIILKMVE